jgi:hypothetical protein
MVERFGSAPSSRAAAAQLRREIQAVAGAEDSIVLDFAGVESISHSFGDELIAVLVQESGRAWFKEHVRIENLGEDERRDLLQAIALRLSRETQAVG